MKTSRLGSMNEQREELTCLSWALRSASPEDVRHDVCLRRNHFRSRTAWLQRDAGSSRLAAPGGRDPASAGRQASRTLGAGKTSPTAWRSRPTEDCGAGEPGVRRQIRPGPLQTEREDRYSFGRPVRWLRPQNLADDSPKASHPGRREDVAVGHSNDRCAMPVQLDGTLDVTFSGVEDDTTFLRRRRRSRSTVRANGRS